MAVKTPKTKKGLTTALTKATSRLTKLREAAKKRRSPSKRRVYDASTWKGKPPAPLGVYFIRIMRDEKEVGGFGPYATVRAAAADAKNILRLNIGPGHKIVETGPVVPVIRSDKKIKLYLHPESYSAQVAGKGVISAQVIETAGNEERLKPGPGDLGTFGVSYNPRRRRNGGANAMLYFSTSKEAWNAVHALDASGIMAGYPSLKPDASGYYTVQVAAKDEDRAYSAIARHGGNRRNGRLAANPHIAFKTRSGKTVSFEAKHRNPAYAGGLDKSAKIVVEGVKGMKSTPFRKTFRNFAAYLKWSDSDAAANCSIYRVSNE